MEDDLSYFMRRVAEERIAAFNAPHPKAKRAHMEMAERYERRVRAMAKPNEGRLHLVH